MDSNDQSKIAGSPEINSVIVSFEGVSKWYGTVIGLNNLTLRIKAGVTGLLGPNGAGKSTLLQLATGQLRPSMGEVRVLGHTVWNNPHILRFIGLCPEQDAFYEWMTGWQFVYACARLTGMSKSQAHAATSRAIEEVKMIPNMNRAIRGYSKGMRQRIKIAQALVHEPRVLFLDEPFTGTDPIARREMMDLMSKWAQEGKSIILSSHVLHEVQAITSNIILINRGRLLAEGNLRQIRDLIDDHPHRIVLVSKHYRHLAAQLVQHEDVVGMEFDNAKNRLLVQTKRPDSFYDMLPDLALSDSSSIDEVYSEDDNIEAVFKYLVHQ